MTHGSGDYVIAFSTAKNVRMFSDSINSRTQHLLSDEALSPLFQAAVETTEEAIYNSLFKATTMTGMGRTVEPLPIYRESKRDFAKIWKDKGIVTKRQGVTADFEIIWLPPLIPAASIR